MIGWGEGDTLERNITETGRCYSRGGGRVFAVTKIQCTTGQHLGQEGTDRLNEETSGGQLLPIF